MGRGQVRCGGTSKSTKRIMSTIFSNSSFRILCFVCFVPANFYPLLQSPCRSFVLQVTLKFIVCYIWELHLITHCARPEDLEFGVPETVLCRGVRVRGATFELLAMFAWVVLPASGWFVVTGLAAASSPTFVM
jgi:hypothetical protein